MNNPLNFFGFSSLKCRFAIFKNDNLKRSKLDKFESSKITSKLKEIAGLESSKITSTLKEIVGSIPNDNSLH